jgi:hypothetical protein
VLPPSDTEEVLATVNGHAVQKKLNKEQEKLLKEKENQQKSKKQQKISSNAEPKPQLSRLQDYCPAGVYISVAITYPADVVRFQVVPQPELKGLTRVSIDVNDNSFPLLISSTPVKQRAGEKQLAEYHDLPGIWHGGELWKGWIGR